MNSGLRMSGMNGPFTPLRGPAVSSAAALRCASFILSAASGGMRSWNATWPTVHLSPVMFGSSLCGIALIGGPVGTARPWFNSRGNQQERAQSEQACRHHQRRGETAGRGGEGADADRADDLAHGEG